MYKVLYVSKQPTPSKELSYKNKRLGLKRRTEVLKFKMSPIHIASNRLRIVVLQWLLSFKLLI